MAAQPLPHNPSAAPRARRRPGPAGRTRRAGRTTVESMASKVTRPCQRNDCPAPARAGVELNHGDMVATLVSLPAERDPRRMELCVDHADRMTVPRGWTCQDDRDDDDLPVAVSGPPSADELASPATVDLLAAALGEPGDVDELGHVDDGQGADEADHDPTPDRHPASAAARVAVALAHDPTVDLDHPGSGHGGPDGGPDGGPVGPPIEAHDADAGVAASGDGTARDPVAGGTQLVLAEAADLARRARPVPAAEAE